MFMYLFEKWDDQYVRIYILLSSVDDRIVRNFIIMTYISTNIMIGMRI